ncbi:hypothetical protein IQ268_24420 [Oculatella sp. LEGE 06141]|uniref:hypothetical protein n=1 Tax=Oculatella sp. LEGE 06141 TaxID=1828648 RepID=UPI0018818132|nr:hypothetical protein [Oculatella sp. LEGE 06141]MBE9181715.1 hypothetical protein [Oculatella sp. LEGE 06141]
MTSQQPQIQSLINQIDRVLNKTSPRLPWVMSGEMTQQRQLLEQTRSYLMALQRQSLPADEPYGRGGFASDPGYSQYQSYPQTQANFPNESPQQVLQAVVQEMNYLRRNMMQPLRSEVEQLQQQKSALTQEIRQLEAQRQQYALPQQSADRQFIADYLQNAINRMQENLSRQMAQSFQPGLEGQPVQGRSLPGDNEMGGAMANQSALSSAQQLEWLQSTQTQTDEMLLNLDSTLRVVFESLLRDVHSYQDSLQQELQKMHNLGQQGEALFAALLSRLAQQLGREASSYVQSLDPAAVGALDPSLQDRSLQPSALEDISDAEIDQLLDELTSGESTPETAIAPDNPDTAAPNPYLESGTLDQLGLDLENLDLEAPGGGFGSGGSDVTPIQSDERFLDDDITLFQVDDDDDTTLFQVDDDDDVTLFQVDDDDDDITMLQIDEQPEASPGLGAVGSGIGELESAFNLLDQLNVEEDPSLLEGSSLRQMGLTPTPPDDDEDLALPPDDQDLDRLYESIFGSSGTITADSPSTEELDAESLVTPVDEPLLSETASDGDQEVELDPAIESWLFSDRNAPSDDSAPFNDSLSEADTPTFGEPTDDLFDEPINDLPGTATEGGSPLDQDLFDDVPASTSPEMGLADQLATMETPQSAEDFLFRMDEPLGASTATDMLDPLTSVGETAYPDAPNDVAIAALSDLIDITETRPETEAPQPSSEQLTNVDDTYIPAAPDEDLLVTGEPPSESRLDLRLAANTLQQLTADLSSLEGLEIDDPVGSPSGVEETGWTLDQWTETAQPLPEPPPETDPEQIFSQAITQPATETDAITPAAPAVANELQMALPDPDPMLAELGISDLDALFRGEDIDDASELGVELSVEPEPPVSPDGLETPQPDLPMVEVTDESGSVAFDQSDQSDQSDTLLEDLFGSLPEAATPEPTVTAEGLMDDSAEDPASISDSTLEALLADEPTEIESPSVLDDATLEGLFSDDFATGSEPSAMEAALPDGMEATEDGDLLSGFFDSDISTAYQFDVTPDDPDVAGEATEAAIATTDLPQTFIDIDLLEAFESSVPVTEPTIESSGRAQEGGAVSDDVAAGWFDSDASPAYQTDRPSSDPEITISGFGRDMGEEPEPEWVDDLFSIPELEESPLPLSEPEPQERSLTLDDFVDTLPTDAPAASEPFAEDLFGEDFPAVPPTTAPNDASDAELTLADFAAKTSESGTFTLEGLDNLFDDLPAMSTATDAEPEAGAGTPPANPQTPFFADTDVSDSESLEKKNNPRA